MGNLTQRHVCYRYDMNWYDFLLLVFTQPNLFLRVWTSQGVASLCLGLGQRMWDEGWIRMLRMVHGSVVFWYVLMIIMEYVLHPKSSSQRKWWNFARKGSSYARLHMSMESDKEHHSIHSAYKGRSRCCVHLNYLWTFPSLHSRFQTISSFVKLQNAAKALQCKSRANHQTGRDSVLNHRKVREKNFKTYHKMSKLRQVCKEPPSPFGDTKLDWQCPSAQTSWHGLPPDMSSFHSEFQLTTFSCCTGWSVLRIYFCGLKISEMRFEFRWYSNHRNTVHPPTLHDNIATALSFKSEKLKPANCTTPSADLWNIDYGMKRYMCLHICCLDNDMSCTCKKPNGLCTQRVALKKEFPDSLEQKLSRIQQCSSKYCTAAAALLKATITPLLKNWRREKAIDNNLLSISFLLRQLFPTSCRATPW